MRLLIKLLILLPAVIFFIFSARSSQSSGVNVTISSNLDAFFTLSGPATYTKDQAKFWESAAQSLGGYAWTIAGVLPGTYILTFSEMAGYQGELKKTVTVPADYSAISFGTFYEPTKIEVMAFLAPGDQRTVPFRITGPASYSGSTLSPSQWKVERVPFGAYTIVYENISGYTAPPSEIKTVAPEFPNGTIRFAGLYQELAQAVITPRPAATSSATPLPAIQSKTKTTPTTEPTALPQSLPGKAKLMIKSVPDGATVYVNDILAGKTPLTYQVGAGSHKIRCVLAGYDNYYYGAAISDYGARNGTTVEIICKMPSSSSGPGNRLQNLPRDDTSSQEPTLAVPQKPKGFFSRFWQRILSLFGK